MRQREHRTFGIPSAFTGRCEEYIISTSQVVSMFPAWPASYVSKEKKGMKNCGRNGTVCVEGDVSARQTFGAGSLAPAWSLQLISTMTTKWFHRVDLVRIRQIGSVLQRRSNNLLLRVVLCCRFPFCFDKATKVNSTHCHMDESLPRNVCDTGCWTLFCLGSPILTRAAKYNDTKLILEHLCCKASVWLIKVRRNVARDSLRRTPPSRHAKHNKLRYKWQHSFTAQLIQVLCLIFCTYQTCYDCHLSTTASWRIFLSSLLSCLHKTFLVTAAVQQYIFLFSLYNVASGKVKKDVMWVVHCAAEIQAVSVESSSNTPDLIVMTRAECDYLASLQMIPSLDHLSVDPGIRWDQVCEEKSDVREMRGAAWHRAQKKRHTEQSIVSQNYLLTNSGIHISTLIVRDLFPLSSSRVNTLHAAVTVFRDQNPHVLDSNVSGLAFRSTRNHK